MILQGRLVTHDLGDCITGLDLCDKNIDKLPESILKLKKLKKLDISINDISNLDYPIGSLPQLTDLNITLNKLTKVPDFIAHLHRLEYLSISELQLGELPDFIGNFQGLDCLDIGGNKLYKLPTTIANLQELRYLGMYDSEGRIAQITRDGVTQTNVYNGLGQRVQKSVGDDTTVFTYDEDGKLLGEYTPNNQLIREYI